MQVLEHLTSQKAFINDIAESESLMIEVKITNFEIN